MMMKIFIAALLLTITSPAQSEGIFTKEYQEWLCEEVFAMLSRDIMEARQSGVDSETILNGEPLENEPKFIKEMLNAIVKDAYTYPIRTDYILREMEIVNFTNKNKAGCFYLTKEYVAE